MACWQLPWRPDVRAALATAIVVLAAGPLLAASGRADSTAPAPQTKSNEIMVPIPGWAPDVTSNGCHVRKSPGEASPDHQPGRARVSFGGLIDHATGRHAVRASRETPEALAKRIAGLSEDMRRLVYLVVLRDGMGRDGIHTFFFMSSGAHATAIRDALREAGLEREHRLFQRALALFGPDYPADNKVREKLFAYSKGNLPLNAFDQALMAVHRQFGDKQALGDAIAAYVNRTPALFAHIEGLREKLSDNARFRHLDDFLATKIDWKKSADDISRRLGALPAHERNLIALSMFNMEFENGGIHQFFHNSSGDIAPEVLTAMKELGLTEQAEIFRRALTMVGEPYLRDNEARREKSFSGERSDWDKKLSALTDDFYAIGGGARAHNIKGHLAFEGGPGLRDAMLNYAREKKLLPC